MTKDEALKLALEALEAHADIGIKSDKAINAIKEALAQTEQEPVAWMCSDFNLMHRGYSRFSPTRQGEWSIPLYTTPPQRTWVGLTNNDLQPIAEEYRILFGSWVHDFARAIEAKLKEKNT